jgi:hypothetical protein
MMVAAARIAGAAAMMTAAVSAAEAAPATVVPPEPVHGLVRLAAGSAGVELTIRVVTPGQPWRPDWRSPAHGPGPAEQDGADDPGGAGDGDDEDDDDQAETDCEDVHGISS